MNILEELERKIYAAGETIFESGDVGDCAYLIEKGSVEVVIDQGGEEFRLSVLKKGELFGEVALIDHGPRTATVRALKKTVLIPFPRELVQGLLENSDPVLRHLLLVILERYRHNQNLAPALSAHEATGLDENERASLKGEATEKLSMVHSMAQGLVLEEFELHYQPICDLSTLQIVGFEALIRWKHPVRGLISPAEFLWLAEQTGMIREMGIWTLEQACRDWKELRQFVSPERPFISVNLSPTQLNDEVMVTHVKDILEKYSMNAPELKFELTETVLIEQPDLAAQILAKLVELGTGLALDDYGIGYSGLNHLQSYPIGTLKIDKSFVGPLLDSSLNLEIVQSSIELAHSLNMLVVAEGIENENILRQLIEMGCDCGQGWLFGRPQPLADYLAIDFEDRAGLFE